MIRYALACKDGHGFEGWFGSSADYDDQEARGLLQCPLCGSGKVGKQIMAPSVAGTKAQGKAEAAGGGLMEVMSQLRGYIEENFEDVGDTFATEARAIHAGESESRGIYGQATGGEVVGLLRDGVPVAPLPPKPPAKGEIH